VWRVARGERSYLPEVEGDRLTLRALTGEGERLRVELRTPLLGGRVRLGATTTTQAARAVRPVWLAEWTRRSTARR
jgi:hypothetical protein